MNASDILRSLISVSDKPVYVEWQSWARTSAQNTARLRGEVIDVGDPCIRNPEQIAEIDYIKYWKAKGRSEEESLEQFHAVPNRFSWGKRDSLDPTYNNTGMARIIVRINEGENPFKSYPYVRYYSPDLQSVVRVIVGANKYENWESVAKYVDELSASPKVVEEVKDSSPKVVDLTTENVFEMERGKVLQCLLDSEISVYCQWNYPAYSSKTYRGQLVCVGTPDVVDPDTIARKHFIQYVRDQNGLTEKEAKDEWYSRTYNRISWPTGTARIRALEATLEPRIIVFVLGRDNPSKSYLDPRYYTPSLSGIDHFYTSEEDLHQQKQKGWRQLRELLVELQEESKEEEIVEVAPPKPLETRVLKYAEPTPIATTRTWMTRSELTKKARISVRTLTSYIQRGRILKKRDKGNEFLYCLLPTAEWPMAEAKKAPVLPESLGKEWLNRTEIREKLNCADRQISRYIKSGDIETQPLIGTGAKVYRIKNIQLVHKFSEEAPAAPEEEIMRTKPLEEATVVSIERAPLSSTREHGINLEARLSAITGAEDASTRLSLLLSLRHDLQKGDVQGDKLFWEMFDQLCREQISG